MHLRGGKRKKKKRNKNETNRKRSKELHARSYVNSPVGGGCIEGKAKANHTTLRNNKVRSDIHKYNKSNQVLHVVSEYARSSAGVLWYPLIPFAALQFVALAPSSYLAGVIACLYEAEPAPFV